MFFERGKDPLKEYVMALDAGTGSCRAVIFDNLGKQVAMAQEEWSHKPLEGFPSSQVFDTKANWKLITRCIRASLSESGLDPGRIGAVSATSMREGMVLYDSSGKEIWACPNVDSRARHEAEYLVRTGKARKIYRISGDWVSITSAPRFLWIKKYEPDVFRRIANVGMISDWILYRLSGEYVTDPSIGSSSGMFDLKKRKWSDEIISMCGLDERMFPDVESPGEVIGKVTMNAAAETTLAEGTPVVVGGADTQLGLLGLGVSKPRQMTLLGGSFWQTTMLLDKPIIDPKIRLRTLCHVANDKWMIEGIGFYSGLAMRWFRDAFCETEKEEARQRGVDSYVIMEEKAGLVSPGSNGTVAIFSNLMNAKRWAHAAPSFMQFDVTSPVNSGRKECIRAIEEAAVYVAYGHLKILNSLSGRGVREVTFAGGAAKGSLWPQILADVLGVTVNVPAVKESTALGAAISAFVGAGTYRDIEAGGRELARIETVYEPSRKNHEKYLALYEKWAKVYHEALKLSDSGLLDPMWKAAGA